MTDSEHDKEEQRRLHWLDWLNAEILEQFTYHNHKEKMAWGAIAATASLVVLAHAAAPLGLVVRVLLGIALVMFSLLVGWYARAQFNNKQIATNRIVGYKRAKARLIAESRVVGTLPAFYEKSQEDLAKLFRKTRNKLTTDQTKERSGYANVDRTVWPELILAELEREDIRNPKWNRDRRKNELPCYIFLFLILVVALVTLIAGAPGGASDVPKTSTSTAGKDLASLQKDLTSLQKAAAVNSKRLEELIAICEQERATTPRLGIPASDAPASSTSDAAPQQQ